jgi:hypothetical protein
MSEETITLTLPYLPPVSFSPNWRGFWARRAKDGRQVKEDVHWILYERYGLELPRYNQIHLKYIVVVPDKRDRDEDNFRSRTKPMTDGLRDDYEKPKGMPAVLSWLGLVADDTPKYIQRPIDFEFRYEKGEKKTIIEIIPIGGRIV